MAGYEMNDLSNAIGMYWTASQDIFFSRFRGIVIATLPLLISICSGAYATEPDAAEKVAKISSDIENIFIRIPNSIVIHGDVGLCKMAIKKGLKRDKGFLMVPSNRFISEAEIDRNKYPFISMEELFAPAKEPVMTNVQIKSLGDVWYFVGDFFEGLKGSEHLFVATKVSESDGWIGQRAFFMSKNSKIISGIGISPRSERNGAIDNVVWPVFLNRKSYLLVIESDAEKHYFEASIKTGVYNDKINRQVLGSACRIGGAP